MCIFVQIAEFDWLPWHIKGKFSKKCSKIFSSEAIRGMKLKLCIHVHDISLYINCVFYCHCQCAIIAMATYFPLTYNGKSGNWHLFKFYWNVSGLVFYQPYEFCPNRWFWQPKGYVFGKKYSKIFTEAISGMELKFCINIHDISLYIKYFLLLRLCFR